MGKRGRGDRQRYRRRDRPGRATAEIPEHLRLKWPILYLTAIRQVATLEEVTRHWDLDEVFDAIETLDIMDDLGEDQIEADRRARERKATR